MSIDDVINLVNRILEKNKDYRLWKIGTSIENIVNNFYNKIKYKIDSKSNIIILKKNNTNYALFYNDIYYPL